MSVEFPQYRVGEPRRAWEAVEAVGEGEEYRAELDGDRGAALYAQGSLVHGSISAAAA